MHQKTKYMHLNASTDDHLLASVGSVSSLHRIYFYVRRSRILDFKCCSAQETRWNLYQNAGFCIWHLLETSSNQQVSLWFPTAHLWCCETPPSGPCRPRHPPQRTGWTIAPLDSRGKEKNWTTYVDLKKIIDMDTGLRGTELLTAMIVRGLWRSNFVNASTIHQGIEWLKKKKNMKCLVNLILRSLDVTQSLSKVILLRALQLLT